jgi:hypothetical protein
MLLHQEQLPAVIQRLKTTKASAIIRQTKIFMSTGSMPALQAGIQAATQC